MSQTTSKNKVVVAELVEGNEQDSGNIITQPGNTQDTQDTQDSGTTSSDKLNHEGKDIVTFTDDTKEDEDNSQELAIADATTEEPEEPTKSNDDDNSPAQEMWDVVQVLHDNDSAQECRTDACTTKAVVVWKSSLAPIEDVWPLCEVCQERDFGGWPDDKNKNTTVEAAVTASTDPTSNTINDDIMMKEVVDEESSSNGDAKETEKEEDGKWDLVKILSVWSLSQELTVKCGHDHCKLPAATQWHCKSSGEKWYSCIDCQEADYEGWPEPTELPLTFMTADHKELMVSKCSKNKNTVMPNLPVQNLLMDSTTAMNSPDRSLPSHSLVTPSPNNGDSLLSKAKGRTNDGKSAKVTPMPAVKKSKKPTISKTDLEIHRKWLSAAQKLGGPDAKIVVSYPEAKKLIYDMLYESFAPMNITDIHKHLKAAVPNPVLKTCLDDMTMGSDHSDQFADSDDDQPKKKKIKKVDSSDPYKNSLSFKSGKGPNSSLYYVNYATAKNGDGLELDEKNKLLTDLSLAKEAVTKLTTTCKEIDVQTKQLLSEPTNEEAKIALVKEELELADLQEKITTARKLQVNEGHKKKTKQRITKMTAYWRTRRRVCKSFMVDLEELTDGAITAKKCFAGDGQIELDSDEAVAKGAVAYAQQKKAKVTRRKSVHKSGVPPSESFVAVLMNTQGLVSRVHTTD